MEKNGLEHTCMHAYVHTHMHLPTDDEFYHTLSYPCAYVICIHIHVHFPRDNDSHLTNLSHKCLETMISTVLFSLIHVHTNMLYVIDMHLPWGSLRGTCGGVLSWCILLEKRADGSL